jgi:hypothetical protein
MKVITSQIYDFNFGKWYQMVQFCVHFREGISLIRPASKKVICRICLSYDTFWMVLILAFLQENAQELSLTRQRWIETIYGQPINLNFRQKNPKLRLL